MPMRAKVIIALQILLSLVVVGALIMCDEFFTRAIIGIGTLVFVTPIAVWQSAMCAIKIGQEAGETHILADLLREHVKLKQGKPG